MFLSKNRIIILCVICHCVIADESRKENFYIIVLGGGMKEAWELRDERKSFIFDESECRGVVHSTVVVWAMEINPQAETH